MVDAAKQEPFVVWGREKAAWNGGDEKLHLQTEDQTVQEPAVEERRGKKLKITHKSGVFAPAALNSCYL